MSSILGLHARLATFAAAVAISLALTGGPAGANHVRCGDVITQDTTLDSDLVECPLDGLRIAASNVTLDLNGHTIDGVRGQSETGVGDVFFGQSGVTVRGGTIRNFEYGIALTRSRDALIEDVVAVDDPDSGIFVQGWRNQVRDSVAIGNTVGIRLEGFGALVSGNVAVGNGVGVYLLEPSHNTVIRNVLRDNGAGVSMSGASGNLVKRNRIYGGRVGIILFNPEGGDAPANDLVGNRITRSAEDGIRINATTGLTRLFGNVVTRSGDDGIAVGTVPATVTDRSAVVAGNTAHHNLDLGIEAVPGVVDGGGNRAFRNLNPLQCLNVVCEPARAKP